MQSLFQSVGHESRSHSNHENVIEVPIENVVGGSARESTPLISTSLAPHERRSAWTLVFITMMLAMLISGVTIGSYLLFEQDKEWTREKRSVCNVERAELTFIHPAEQLLVFETNTNNCFDEDSCRSTLHQIQEAYKGENHMIDLPFNFLIGGNGATYEGSGYNFSGGVDPKFDNSSISLAFIGNFENQSPTDEQMDASQAIISNSTMNGKLINDYKVIFRCRNNCTALSNSWRSYYKL